MNSRWFTVLSTLLLLACGGSEESQTQLADEAAQVDNQLCRNALSKNQERVALQLIDNICGDTWCEGDFNFAFDQLICSKSKSTCTLSLRLLPWDLEPGATGLSRTCETHGFDKFSSLVHTSNAYQQLQQPFYEQLTECIAALEDEVRASLSTAQ